LVILGCGSYTPIPLELKPAALPRYEHINAHVELRIEPSFREAAIPMGVYSMSFGGVLTTHIEQLARSVFADVVDQGGDVVLTPRVVSVVQTRPMISSDDATLQMSIELKVSDSSGTLLWLKTFSAESTSSLIVGMDYPPGEGTNNRLKVVISDIYRRAFESMSRSPELRTLGPPSASRLSTEPPRA
jgi:hypothetical protein